MRVYLGCHLSLFHYHPPTQIYSVCVCVCGKTLNSWELYACAVYTIDPDTYDATPSLFKKILVFLFFISFLPFSFSRSLFHQQLGPWFIHVYRLKSNRICGMCGGLDVETSSSNRHLISVWDSTHTHTHTDTHKRIKNLISVAIDWCPAAWPPSICPTKTLTVCRKGLSICYDILRQSTLLRFARIVSIRFTHKPKLKCGLRPSKSRAEAIPTIFFDNIHISCFDMFKQLNRHAGWVWLLWSEKDWSD